MDEKTIYLLIGASIILGLAAVLIDRVNFPQKRFRPKAVVVDRTTGGSRDRTGAHVIDVDESEFFDDDIDDDLDDETDI